MTTQPIEWAQDKTRYDFRRITHDLTVKAKSSGRFACPGDDLNVPSRFMSGGQILMYEVRCVALRATPSLPTRPAIVMMRVSGDGQEAWFQVTTLVDDIGGVVNWVSNYGGQDFVIHQSIKEERT
jgi:hypothetical protein